MPRAARPKIDGRKAARAAGRVVRDVAAALLQTVLSPDAAQALPANNRLTDVEFTLVGHEQCTPEWLASELATMWPPGVVKGKPLVLVLKAHAPGQHLLVMQFTLTLACNAAQAQADCESVLQAMTDGDAMLGWGVRVTGVR